MADGNFLAFPESPEEQYRDKLLALIKKEVKHIMEEAVTKKSVHEESSSVSSLCCAIDACLSHGLKRRALGLFKTNSTTALLQKVSKNYEPAAHLYRMVQEIENSDPNMVSSMSSDSPTHRSKDRKRMATPATNNMRSHKFLWIKIALFQKKLSGIIDHLVANSSKYYDKEALLSDPVEGEIFASLLIGPCALEYSKIKSQDHFWSDPSADELLQRHRLSNPPAQNGNLTPPAGRRPLGVSYRWPTSSLDFGAKPFSNAVSSAGSDGENTPRSSSLACSPREYVDSLHQNCRSTLLYGKNNVVVRAKGQESPVPGYLSLHSTPYSLLIKWTPNQIMHVGNPDQVIASPSAGNHLSLWDLAMSVNMEEIVYLHCHQSDSGGTIVLVGQDGVQKPPMMFPAGGHLLAFLSCLETGLQPFGQLDPSLGVDREKGKVFPKLRLKGRAVREKSDPAQIQEEEEVTTPKVNKDKGVPTDSSSNDYVFRVMANFQRPESITQEMFEPGVSPNGKSSPGRWSSWLKRTPASDSSASSSMSRSTDETSTAAGADKSIASMCESMRRQIICRAFYGWLTHTRHIRTVRNHLSELVSSRSDLLEQTFTAGLRKETWDCMHDAQGCISPDHCAEIHSLLYFGGCDPSIRSAVWPYLLNHYEFGMTEQERRDRDTETQQHYEITMTEWLAIEVIVKQRDREIAAANLAKLSSESNAESSEFATTDERNGSNEVFSESQAETDVKSEGRTTKSSCKKECDRKVRISRQKQLESRGSQTVTEPIVEEVATEKGVIEEPSQLTADSTSQCPSPTSSNGGVYSTELLDLFSLNLHRIEKDVQRCDRNYPFYMEKENLEKLRNVMCTYVWENLDQGYVQGMCDLVAPLLVIFQDEVMTYSCFIDLMKRMVTNFPYGGAMDAHFSNLRSLIQVLDYELFELMHANGDYTHFYFCYRWFLLDFKRELLYEDVFRVWEAIWSAKSVSTSNFVLFIAAALVEFYRDIIIGNNMDFTDIIKFFNEMAERHDAKTILKIARGLVQEIQTMVDEL